MIASHGRVSTGLMIFAVLLFVSVLVAVHVDPCFVRASTRDHADGGAVGPDAIAETDEALAEAESAFEELHGAAQEFAVDEGR